MSIEKCLVDLELHHFEYAFLLEDSSTGSRTFRVNVPKIMPLIPRSSPTATPNVYNNNIFANDPACKPDSSPSMTTQNFITIPRFANTEFGKYKDPDNDGIIRQGERFIAVVMDLNIKDMYLTDNI